MRAVVAFYGTELWLQSEYSVARAAYLGHYAEVDEWEPVDEVQGTQEALRAAGCEVKFYTYPGVGHWFFEEDRADHYDAQAARLAWERTVEFLHGRLRPNLYWRVCALRPMHVSRFLGYLSPFIQPSAGKVRSPNFALTESSEVLR